MTRSDISENEIILVEELRRRMKGKMNEKMFQDYSVFQRFLRARCYDLNEAEKMLTKHVVWRKSNKVDSILDWYTPHEVTAKYIPGNFIGFDREGCPIMYFHYENVDTKGILKSITQSEISNFVVHLFEGAMKSMETQSQKLGRPIEKVTIIFNFINFSLLTATHRETLIVAGNLLKIYEANFPERLKVAYVINASMIFTLFFAVVKPFITGNTFKKIKIFGRDGWMDALLDSIHPDVLPAYLGGNKTDPDGNPLCKSMICYPSHIPESYYVHRGVDGGDFSKQKGVRSVKVGAMSKAEVRVEVLYPSTVLEWEFQTRSKDISFSLLYRRQGESSPPQEVVPKQRADTSLQPEAGMYRCEMPGIYILEFDNTYSWLNQKEVFCKVSVVTPQMQKSSLDEENT